MLKVLTKKEIRKQNHQIMQWVRDALEGAYGTYLFNLLTTLKQLDEARERDAHWRRKNALVNEETNAKRYRTFTPQQLHSLLSQKLLSKDYRQGAFAEEVEKQACFCPYYVPLKGVCQVVCVNGANAIKTRLLDITGSVLSEQSV